MTAKQLFEAGKVKEAEKALNAWLRNHPADVTQRTFLFELLCFSGLYDRAEKQLAVLAQGGGPAELGAVMYYSVLHAERSRNELFQKELFPTAPAAPSPSGMVNGKSFQSLQDVDSTIGARLEVYAAGAYLWIPFEHIESIKMDAPQRLRDTLWAPALVVTGPSFKGTELGEVLIPVIYPFSWKHPDESIWLGHGTAWGEDAEGQQYPSGQKLFLVDGDELPVLEVRTIEFATAHAPAQ